MKHLMTAALVATVLALPVKAEQIVLRCAFPQGNTINFELDTDLQSIIQQDAGEATGTQIIVWNDHVIAWVIFTEDEQFTVIETLMLDRETLILETSWIMNNAPNIGNILNASSQCFRPI